MTTRNTRSTVPPGGNIQPPESVKLFHVFVPENAVNLERFVAWLEEAHVFSQGEIPNCWRQHRALVDIILAMAVSRISIEQDIAAEAYSRELTQWWMDITELRAIMTRWTDSCQRQHTPD